MAKKYVTKFKIGDEDIYIKDEEKLSPKGITMTAIGFMEGNVVNDGDKRKYTSDCTFFKTPNGKVIMCDAGMPNNNPNYVQSFLTSKGITRVDLIYISHYHTDHVGNLANLLSKLSHDGCVAYIPYMTTEQYNRVDADVRNNYDTVKSVLQNNGISINYLTTEGQLVTIDDVNITFYNTNHQTYYNLPVFNYNNCSVCCRIEYHNSSIFMSGDVVEAAEDYLATVVPHCDIVKFAHHGYNRFVSDTYFRALSPSVYFALNAKGIANKDASTDADEYFLDERSGENNYAQTYKIPVYPTSESSDWTIEMNIGIGGYTCKSKMIGNEITGSEDELSFVNLWGKGSDTYSTASLVDTMNKVKPNRPFKAMVKNYACNIFRTDASTAFASLLTLRKYVGGAYAKSFNNEARKVGRLFEISDNERPQQVEFYHYTNGGNTYKFLQNKSIGNFYNIKALMSNMVHSMDFHVGSDITMKSNGRAGVNRTCYAQVNLQYDVPSSGAVAQKITVHIGGDSVVHYIVDTTKHFDTISYLTKLTSGQEIYVETDAPSNNLRVFIGVTVLGYREGMDDSNIQ